MERLARPFADVGQAQRPRPLAEASTRMACSRDGTDVPKFCTGPASQCHGPTPPRPLADGERFPAGPSLTGLWPKPAHFADGGREWTTRISAMIPRRKNPAQSRDALLRPTPTEGGLLNGAVRAVASAAATGFRPMAKQPCPAILDRLTASLPDYPATCRILRVL